MATLEPLPYGEIQGYCKSGIPAYSNKHDMYFSGERSIDGNLFCGFKYQCVEFARRWLFERKQLVLPEVSWAVHIFQLKTVFDARTAEPVRCNAVRNGTTEKPVADSLLIYPSEDDNIVGHVAVITEVGDDWVRIADQNHRFHKWEGDYAAEILLKHENGVWKIEDHVDYTDLPLYPLGWVTFPDTPNRDPSMPLVLHESLYFQQPEKPYFRRIAFHPEQVNEKFLDLSDEIEAVFARTFGEGVTRSRLGEVEATYYQMNTELFLMCVKYGNELHNIFLEATKQIIESDDKLRLFGISEELWPRLRYSWKTQQKTISGRFDFAFDEKTQLFKCLEYNADSASTLLECATIQRKWATSVGIDDGTTRSAGSYMDGRMKFAWEESGATGRVHFLIDKDDEEMYTAMYVMKNAREAGLETKLCVLFDDFHFDENGTVYDSDGVEVKNVWKTWMWETAINDYKEAQAERGKDWKPTPKDKVRLCDILLGNNWDIKVFEPLWKVITSNKAILPIVYANHPEHPAILRANYELNDELRKTGYARKPIVGRVGRNVTITKPSGVVIAESGGNFGDRDVIYQELFSLPEFDGYYAILGGWVVGDVYSGTGVREDKTLITGLDSPFSALRIYVGELPKPVIHEDLDREEGKYKK